MGGDYARLALVGTTVLLVDQGRGLQIVDAADPGRATRVGGYEPPGPSLWVATTGSRVYSIEGAYGTSGLTSTRLRVVDATDPARLRPLGVVALSRLPNAIAAAGSYVYTAVSPLRQSGQLAAAAGVQVIDVTDPTRPLEGAFVPLEGTYDTTKNPIKVVAADGRLYVLEGDAIQGPGGLQIFDLTDPARPRALGFVEIRAASDLTVLGGRAYAIDFRAAHAIDVSDPAVPTQVRSLPSMLAPAAAANGLLVATGTSVQVWSDDANCPRVVGSYDVVGRTALAGDRIFVAASTQGLYELRFAPLAGGGAAAPCRRLYLPLMPLRGGA